MSLSRQHNIGAYFKAIAAFAYLQFVAGSGNDNVAQDGITIDRQDFTPLLLSGKFVLSGKTTSLGPATATVTVKLFDAADPNAGWTVVETKDAVMYDSDGNQVLEADFDIGGCRRYIRFQVTCDLSAGSVDTLDAMGVFVAGGSEHPITARVNGAAS